MRRLAKLFLGPCVLTLLAGCGRRAELAPARGIVKIHGQAMTTGRVMFVPVEQQAKSSRECPPAFGDIQSDGSFVLGTYASDDGAVVGAHRATIFTKNSQPEDLIEEYRDGAKKKGAKPKKPFEQLRLLSRTFEVVAGRSNEFVIDLTPQEIDRYGEK